MSRFGAFVDVWHALLVREKYAVLFKLSKVEKSCQLTKKRSSNLKVSFHTTVIRTDGEAC